MAKVTVKIHNPGATVNRLKKVFWDKGYPVIRERQKADCNVFVRFQEGHLAESVDDGPGPHDISWNTDYAKRVYYTGNPRRNRNPNASLRWCEKAKRKWAQEWADDGSAAMNGG